MLKYLAVVAALVFAVAGLSGVKILSTIPVGIFWLVIAFAILLLLVFVRDYLRGRVKTGTKGGAPAAKSAGGANVGFDGKLH